jgi:signal transduction histidine kinase
MSYFSPTKLTKVSSMQSPQIGLESLADRFLPGGESVSGIKRQRLFALLLIGMGILGGLISIIDLFIGFLPVALFCASLAIGCPVYLYSFRHGYGTFAKLVAHLHVLAVILGITVIYSEHVFAWAFLIPLALSSMVVFSTKERMFSMFIILATIISLPLYLILHDHSDHVQLVDSSIHVYWIINLSGSLLFSLYIVYTVIRLNQSILEELKAKSAENAHQNKIMLGSIRTRDKLLSMMSHDIRGDIGKTIGVVDVIEQMSLSDEDKSNLLHSLKLDAVKTLATLDNMLQWTRTQQDELNINPSVYEVDRLISLLLSNNDSALAAKSIFIKLSIPVKLKLFVDINMIDSIFRNLVGNAIKFTPIQGVISISAIDLNDQIEFSIQDSGVGMTQEQIDNITKGVQFTTRGTNREKGRGFGMVLVTEFLSKHKSVLNIESTLGKGTIFTFRLPTPPKA